MHFLLARARLPHPARRVLSSKECMAQRRMTSLEVIDTDAFLDMPATSQLLYFHLNARADDDGFVASPQKIARTLNAAADDLKVLAAKKFIIEFKDGICVIKHWRVNNFIRKDIYKETNYLDLKDTLFIRGNGAYTQSDDGRAIPVPKGHYKLEDVNDTLTQRQLRIGKGSKGKIVAEAIVIETPEESENSRPTKIPKDEQASSLLRWAENRRGFKFTSDPAQLGAIGRAKRAGISPTRLKNRWIELESEA